MTTPQANIGSGFGAQTTATEVLAGRRLDGVRAIVTGGYAGVGLATTRALVAAGAEVLVPARSADKARAALAALDLGGPRVTLAALDLADPRSIDAFAGQVTGPLHLLINNAGIMAAPLSRDARGYESQLATNHIGHFQLTVRLLPALYRANGARVVALTSRGHMRAGVDFDDAMFVRRPYDPMIAYGQSKTANALFALALDARGEAHGLRAFSVHPGAVITDLMRFMTSAEQEAAKARAGNAFKTVEQGAATSIWAATSPQLAGLGGVYCEDCDIAEPMPASDTTSLRGVRPWATDRALAERLWTASERWIA